MVQKEQEDHQRKRKVGNLENQDLVKHLQKQSKWVLIAFIFDLFHYNIYPLFSQDSQLYVYDTSQSVAFLLYIYAIYKLVPEQLMLMHFITSAWLWFSIGDVFNMVYNADAIESIRFENWLLLFNVFLFSYKFKYELLLKYEILLYAFKLRLI
jgi:hypothetical protein